MHVFERGMHHSSVRIAKEYHTIGKYMKITEDNFKVEITRSQIRINLTGEKS